MYSATRRDRALEFTSYVAVIVAAIAYTATLFQAHANVAKDVRLLGYLQLPGIGATTRDRATDESGYIAIDGSNQSASATWQIRRPQTASESTMAVGRRDYVFVVGSPTFSQPDGVATVALIDRGATSLTTIGAIHAVGDRMESSQSTDFVSIPPTVDPGMKFQLPASLSCRPNCTLRIAIAHGTWNVQRVGLESELDPRIGAPLWTESFETFALTIALALAICVASYACLRYVLKPKANS